MIRIYIYNYYRHHATCDNQWNISIPQSKDKILLLLECKTISHISEFQIYKVENECTHIFTPTDYEMIDRFPGKEGSIYIYIYYIDTITLSLSPGYYTLLPILEPYIILIIIVI